MGTIGLQRGVQNLLIGAGRENFRQGLTLDLREPCLASGLDDQKWSILYRFYPQTSACSIRPRRQIKAAGPSIQLFDRNPSGCPVPSLRNLSSERKSSCKCLQCCKENR
jgi:hypothetical protein